MTAMQIQENRATFALVAREYIHREGLAQLLHYLDSKTDFFQAPSSTNFHLNEPGGLCLHSLNVFETALRIHKSVLEPACQARTLQNPKKITEESIAITALFHDLCKCNTFQLTTKWKKGVNHQWNSYDGYELVDEFPFGHGEKSCLIVSHYMQLSREEFLAIRWHMGLFDAGEPGSSCRRTFSEACKYTPLVPLIQSADMLTSLCLEPTIKH